MESVEQISKLVEREIQVIIEPRLVERIRQLLVIPYPIERAWDYGAPNDRFVCWTVLEHPESNTGVSFCADGFGPSYPWGLVFLSGPHMNIGMDSGWFISLEQAFRESMAWGEQNPDGYESQ